MAIALVRAPTSAPPLRMLRTPVPPMGIGLSAAFFEVDVRLAPELANALEALGRHRNHRLARRRIWRDTSDTAQAKDQEMVGGGNNKPEIIYLIHHFSGSRRGRHPEMVRFGDNIHG